jgi:hypothetical protein
VEGAVPTQDVTTVGERLVRGVLDHRVLSLIYHGERRIVEPYLVGIHEAGEPVLVGYQTGGGSRSGELPGWRTFIITEVQGAELLEEEFTPMPGFNPGAYPMLELFARA